MDIHRHIVVLIVGAILSQASLSYVLTTQEQSADTDFCGTCVDFAEESLNALLNEIINKYTIGSCDDICGRVDKELDVVICGVLCDYVGIKAFINAIVAADLDPIYFCELLGQCQVVNGGLGNITDIIVAPLSGTLGLTFQIVVQFTIFNRTSTGISAISIQPPGNYGAVGENVLNEGYKPGNFQIKFNIDTSEPIDQNGKSFPIGLYQVNINLCSGTCGANHPYAFLLSSGIASFTITK